MLWLAIHLPLLPLEVFESLCPEQSDHKNTYRKNSATAIFEEKRGRNTISHYNQSAKEQGIEAGMSDSSAMALCHDIQLIARNINKEKKLLVQLAETAYLFSSQVVLHSTEEDLQHSLLLEVSRSLMLFGGFDQLIKLIGNRFAKHPLSSTGFYHQLATAKYPLLSEVLARSLYTQKHPYPPQQENAITEQSKLIPIALLDCDKSSKQQCEAMGLNTLNEIIELPRDALGRRFRKSFIDHLNQLDGNVLTPPRLFTSPEDFERELFYVHGLRSHEDLSHPMRKLLEELSLHLRFQQKASTEINWRFFRFSKKSHYLTVYFSKPQIQANEMLDLCLLQLPQLPMDSPVESISLQAKKFLAIQNQSEQHAKNNDLFGFSADANSHKKSTDPSLPKGDQRLLKDRIQARLGNDRLYLLEKQNHLLPEKKYLKTSTHSRNTNATFDSMLSTRYYRPRWLLPTPGEIFIKSDKNPMQAVIDGENCLLTILKGPERLATNDKEPRDYFIVGKLSSSKDHYRAIYWAYQNLQTRQWFLQGVF